MDHSATFFATVLASFFAIMNPVANTPIFLGLTQEMDDKTTRQVALRGVVLAFVIVAVFSTAGKYIFDIFGVTLPAFRIAGGLLVGLVGFHLLQGDHSSVHKAKDEDTEQSRDAALGIAVSPLAMPLLAGPGTIVTGMNYAAGGSLDRLAVVLGAFFLICVATYICFVSGERITRVLGKNFLMVISRLMGLILAVIGAQMLIDGVRGAIQAVAK